MARKYLVPIDLTKQELQNARIQNLASAPASPVAGQIYFNTSDNTLYFYDGTAWVAAKTNPYSYAASGETTDISITATESNGTSANLARADHQHAGPGFGSPYAIDAFGLSPSDGTSDQVARANHSHGSPAHTDTEHSDIHLNALAAPTANVSMGTYKLTSVGDPASAQDAATKNYVDNKALNSFTAGADVSLSNYKITNLANPSLAQDAATKAYVDGRKVTDLTAPTSAFSMNSQKITNLATPTTDYDAANKLYVDQAVQGLSWKEAVHLFAASNVPLTGSTGLVIDGHSPLDSTDNGYRILLTGQTTGSQNGIYVYTDNGTTYTLSRATDADTHDELIGATVFVQEGTTYGSTSWVQTNHYLTDFSNQTWVQFSGAGTYTASNGVVLSAKDFQFAPKTDGGLATGASGAFVKLQTNSGLGTTSNGLAVGAGTGISVSSGTVAIDTAVVARKYSQTLTGALTSLITVTHNLNTTDVTVQVYTVSDGSQVEVDVNRTGVNAITLGFAVAPTSNQYRVVVIG